MLGKSQPIKGCNNLVITFSKPDLSAILAIPNHKVSIPVNLITSMTAIPEAVMASLVILPTFPCKAATKMLITIRKPKTPFIVSPPILLVYNYQRSFGYILKKPLGVFFIQPYTAMARRHAKFGMLVFFGLPATVFRHRVNQYLTNQPNPV